MTGGAFTSVKAGATLALTIYGADTMSADTLASACGEIARLRNDMELHFAKIEDELKLHRWMLGAILGGIISLMLKSFF